jgi:hypothetical protein
MNARIKQITELSKAYKTILVDGQMQSVLLIDPERFTKMIVEDCLELIDSAAEPLADGSESQALLLAISLGMLDHFDIELNDSI